jgi:hypothetical protein
MLKLLCIKLRQIELRVSIDLNSKSPSDCPSVYGRSDGLLSYFSFILTTSSAQSIAIFSSAFSS